LFFGDVVPGANQAGDSISCLEGKLYVLGVVLDNRAELDAKDGDLLV